MATLTYKGSYVNSNSYVPGDVVTYPYINNMTPWVAWANIKPGSRPGVNHTEWGTLPKGTGDDINVDGIVISVDDWLDSLDNTSTTLNPNNCIDVPKSVNYDMLARIEALEARISELGFPDDTFIDISISGSSGSMSYKAPRNGWLYLSAMSTGVNGSCMIGIDSNGMTLREVLTSGLAVHSVMPISSGQTASVVWYQVSTPHLRFIPARQ